jgi:tRNA (guanosine-2'-O-)-methyltransferase
MVTERRTQRIKKILNYRQTDLTVVCENIHDPHNVSAILRSCDAVGVNSVHLLYTSETFPKLGKKSSASAKKWLEFKQHRNHQELHKSLKDQNMMIYATYIDPSAKSIFDVDWTQPAAIIMGNEHRGVSSEALAIADQMIFIPMFGMIESLNVSVATAVTLYEACRQRLLKQQYNQSKDPAWIKQNLNRWTKR